MFESGVFYFENYSLYLRQFTELKIKFKVKVIELQLALITIASILLGQPKNKNWRIIISVFNPPSWRSIIETSENTERILLSET